MRCDSNDYSVDPTVIGRRIEVVADLERVRVFCDGRLVADHARLWAKHQSVADPDHVATARRLRHERLSLLTPAAATEVEIRCLADYDSGLGPRWPAPRIPPQRTCGRARNVFAANRYSSRHQRGGCRPADVQASYRRHADL